MRDDPSHRAVRWRQRRGERSLAGRMAVIAGVVGPMLLIILVVWIAFTAMRYLAGIA